MLLSDCPIKTRARLTSIDVEPAYRLRLEELGLRPGAAIQVSAMAAFGGIVVNVAGTRVAVDKKSSRRIDVELAA